MSSLSSFCANSRSVASSGSCSVSQADSPEKREASGVRYVKDGAAMEARVREGGLNFKSILAIVSPVS